MALTKGEKILVGGIIVVGGWLAWKKWGKKAVESPSSDKEKVTETNIVPVVNTAISDYKKKVMAIQLWLGVAVDGIAGPQTNGALAKKLPDLFSKLGQITPFNIDEYAKASGSANSSLSNTDQAKITSDLIDKIMNANGVLTLTEEVNAPALIFDQATGSYRATGARKVFPKGFRFANNWYNGTSWLKSNRGGKSILLRKDGEQERYEFSPYSIIVV